MAPRVILEFSSMTARGAILTLGVIVLFLAIFVPLALRVMGGNARVIDADRLRHTYVALTLYETEHDGQPAPNLDLIRRDVEIVDLQSAADPQTRSDRHEDGAIVKQASFSVDGVLSNLHVRSDTRISWSYRRHWPEAAKDAGLDPRRVILADPWPGSLLRVTMDGALTERPAPADLTFESLFGR